MSDKWTGGCQCGGIRYSLNANAVETMYACHCLDCQRQSASAFGISVIVARTGFNITRGTVKTWVTHGESGNPKHANFCPNCNIRVFHDNNGNNQWISVKNSTLNDSNHLNPGAHLWVKRRQAWLQLDRAIVCHQDEPPD